MRPGSRTEFYEAATFRKFNVVAMEHNKLVLRAAHPVAERGSKLKPNDLIPGVDRVAGSSRLRLFCSCERAARRRAGKCQTIPRSYSAGFLQENCREPRLSAYVISQAAEKCWRTKDPARTGVRKEANMKLTLLAAASSILLGATVAVSAARHNTHPYGAYGAYGNFAGAGRYNGSHCRLRWGERPEELTQDRGHQESLGKPC